jgi:predicted Mrr-cat superfamily restriction endonuclease
MPNDKIHFWKIAPGAQGSLWVEQRDAHCIAVGWNEVGDLRNYQDIDQLKKKFVNLGWSNSPHQLWRFYTEVKPGHKIVASSGQYIYGTGTVTEKDYIYNEDLSFHQCKSVLWEKKFWCPVSVNELNLDENLKKRLGYNRTILELEAEEWKSIRNKLDKFQNPFEGRSEIKRLLKAPQTEQEAIILFSALMENLRMRIVYVGTRFPDAIIQVKQNDKWVTKYAEFELYSSGFEAHMDDYQKDKNSCDMIICWEHDWEKCPKQLEVIELKEKLRSYI